MAILYRFVAMKRYIEFVPRLRPAFAAFDRSRDAAHA